MVLTAENYYSQEANGIVTGKTVMAGVMETIWKIS